MYGKSHSDIAQRVFHYCSPPTYQPTHTSEPRQEEGLPPETVEPCGGSEMCIVACVVSVSWVCDEYFEVSVVYCLR